VSNLIIWGGPVYAPGGTQRDGGDIGRVQWGTDTQIVTFNHGPDGGVGSSAFGELAYSYRDSSGHILAGLLASAGLDADSFDKIAIAGFSAFHGLANPLLLADGDRISAAVLLDACFEGTAAAPKEGYRAFAAQAAKGEKLMVFLGSSGQNGPGLPPTSKGYECAFNAANAGAADVGETLAQVDTPEGIREAKCGTYKAGGLWVLNFCDQFYPDMHGGIVNQLTEETLQTLLVPYLAGTGSSALLGGLPTWAKWTVGGLLVASAAAGGVAWARRRQRAHGGESAALLRG
jgi:hypothetical protein